MPKVVIAWYSAREAEDGYHVFFDCGVSKKIRRNDLVVDDELQIPQTITMCLRCAKRIDRSASPLSSIADAAFWIRT